MRFAKENLAVVKGIIGVYFCIDENDKVVYVGQSSDIIGRIRQHCKYKEFETFNYIECDEDKSEIEIFYITQLNPILNKDKIGLKKYKHIVNMPHVLSDNEEISVENAKNHILRWVKKDITNDSDEEQIRDLAKHINKSEQSLYYKRANHKTEFNLLWLGWMEYLKTQNDKEE